MNVAYKLVDWSLLKPTFVKMSAETGSRNSDHVGLAIDVRRMNIMLNKLKSNSCHVLEARREI